MRTDDSIKERIWPVRGDERPVSGHGTIPARIVWFSQRKRSENRFETDCPFAGFRHHFKRLPRIGAGMPADNLPGQGAVQGEPGTGPPPAAQGGSRVCAGLTKLGLEGLQWVTGIPLWAGENCAKAMSPAPPAPRGSRVSGSQLCMAPRPSVSPRGSRRPDRHRPAPGRTRSHLPERATFPERLATAPVTAPRPAWAHTSPARAHGIFR